MLDSDGILNQLEKQLEDTEGEVKKQTKQRDWLKDDISAVGKAHNEIDQAVSVYSKAWDGQKREKKELTDYYETKWRMILCAVEKNRDDIDNTIAEYKRKIDDQKTKLNDLIQQVKNASKEYEDATKEFNDKQGKFDEYKNYKANLDNKLNEIKALRGQIEKEDDQNHPASMYFLLQELNEILLKTDVISPNQLQDKLKEAWDQLYGAKKAWRQKKATWDCLKDEQEKEQKELNELEQKRRENILSNISKYNQDPEPCPAKTPKQAASGRATDSY